MVEEKKKRIEFGDKNYQMKDRYAAKDLYVGVFERIPYMTEPGGANIETTTQKYIFEIIQDGEETKYREVFTGFIAKLADQNGVVTEYFNIPYVKDPQPITDYLPVTEGLELPKLSLIWALNDINTVKIQEKPMTLKKTQ